MAAITTLRLAYGLSPIARTPTKVRVREQTVAGDPAFVARVYRGPKTPRAAILIAPGVQPFGTDDHRMEGLAQQLAAAGFLVMVPFLPEHLRMCMRARSVQDFVRAYDHLVSLPDFPAKTLVRVLSVSVGSFVAIGLTKERPLNRLFIFGGFLRWVSLIEHALSKRGDPILAPVVFTNLAEYLCPDNAQQMRDAWLSFVTQTWRSPKKMETGFRRRVAESIAPELPSALQELFFVGCGLCEDRQQLGTRGLELGHEQLTSLDATKQVSIMSVPTYIAHGRNDEVIPVSEAQEMYALLPKSAQRDLFVSGLYGHSQTASLGASLRHPIRLAHDLATHIRFMKALSSDG